MPGKGETAVMKYEKAMAEVVDFSRMKPFATESIESFGSFSEFILAHSNGCGGYGNTSEPGVFSCPPFTGGGTYQVSVNGTVVSVTFSSIGEGMWSCSAYYGGGFPY